ncbi:hypothetical protein JHK87_042322 [Glycine soja]|nr:hypothetical protein JHK87_042322 [Glycine soja]
MAMSVARLKKDEIQRLKKEIDSVWRPAMELHELETSAVLKNLLEDRERMPALLVFFDGTAFNNIVEEFKNFTTHIAHVLPVFDDGGSTAKIQAAKTEGQPEAKAQPSHIIGPSFGGGTMDLTLLQSYRDDIVEHVWIGQLEELKLVSHGGNVAQLRSSHRQGRNLTKSQG